MHFWPYKWHRIATWTRRSEIVPRPRKTALWVEICLFQPNRKYKNLIKFDKLYNSESACRLPRILIKKSPGFPVGKKSRKNLEFRRFCINSGDFAKIPWIKNPRLEKIPNPGDLPEKIPIVRKSWKPKIFSYIFLKYFKFPLKISKVCEMMAWAPPLRDIPKK